MTDCSSFASCLKKQAAIEQFFNDCLSPDEKYQKIIALGKDLSPYPENHKTSDKIVSGCQSIMYLHTYFEAEKMRFLAHSDALISAGLAALLLLAYDKEEPEVVLKCPPYFLDKIGIQSTISPGRSNGLANLFLKMKQQSVQYCFLI